MQISKLHFRDLTRNLQRIFDCWSSKPYAAENVFSQRKNLWRKCFCYWQNWKSTGWHSHTRQLGFPQGRGLQPWRWLASDERKVLLIKTSGLHSRKLMRRFTKAVSGNCYIHGWTSSWVWWPVLPFRPTSYIFCPANTCPNSDSRSL